MGNNLFLTFFVEKFMKNWICEQNKWFDDDGSHRRPYLLSMMVRFRMFRYHYSVLVR